MASRRGVSHRQHHHQAVENWSLTPILDHQITSSTSPPKRPQFIRKPRNRGGKGKSRVVKEDDDSGGSNLNLDSNCGDFNGEDEVSVSGPGSSLNLDSNCGVFNGEEEVSVSEPGSSLNLDSNCGVFNGEEEVSVSELGSSLNLDSNCGVFNGGEEVCISGSGSRLNLGVGEIVEGLNSRGEVDVFQRLRELSLSSVGEPVLPDDLINQQLQADELLVMESIYGDNIFILDDQDGLKCFQVHIHVEVPKGLHITAKFKSSNTHETSSEDSSDFSYSFQVEYLAPIVLTCLLPKSYPSKHAPYFTISVPWLGSTKISDLCSKLDLIWLEQTGQEVIYQWVEWLCGSTLSYLGFDAEIVLGPYGVRNEEVDRRAISESVSPDIDIPSMKSYNDEKRHENFCRNIQECGICLSEFAGSNFIKLPCQHFFCEKCLKTFSDIHMMDGTVLKLKCPEPKCDGVFPPGLVKRLLREEEYERWESLMLEKTLESMADVVYCPRCETACLQDEDDHALCSKCYYSFCTLCWEKRHVGGECMTPEMKLKLLKERQNGTSVNINQRRREQDMINQILSLKEIRSTAKQCPTCGMAISRTEGCNKMVCKNCGQYFCYRCNRKIAGYDHFRNGECELFPQEEIGRWEARINERQAFHQLRAEVFGGRALPCPNCRQNNVKVGNNNHMFCWSCQNHYCYLCRKMVKRSSEHYVPKGCKQHTDG